MKTGMREVLCWGMMPVISNLGTKVLCMKRLFPRWVGIMVGLVSLAGCEPSAPPPTDNLPWQIERTLEGNTQVFHLEVGKTTLREAIEQWHNFPELAVFTQGEHPVTLEAYFGKQRLGMFEARIVAELDITQSMLERFAAEGIDRKPQQSGAWRLGLSEPNQALANGLPIKYLIYMPVADYGEDIVRTRFGEPDSVTAVGDDAAYWFYPKDGLVILMNNDGGDILYYSAEQDYAALQQRVLTQPERKHD